MDDNPGPASSFCDDFLGYPTLHTPSTVLKPTGCSAWGLATRGASDFYLALGYRESATYYKKPIHPNKTAQATPALCPSVSDL